MRSRRVENESNSPTNSARIAVTAEGADPAGRLRLSFDGQLVRFGTLSCCTPDRRPATVSCGAAIKIRKT